MSDDAEFVLRFREAVAARGWRRDFSPIEIDQMWSQFVDLCEEGYEGSIFEYDNDLSVRDLIADLLTDPTLEPMSQLAWFKEHVATTDARFEVLLQPAAKSAPGERWWRHRVLRYAGSELAADLRSKYGVAVEER